MKKRFAAAIAVMALLSGCDGNNGKSAVDTSESAAQTTESSAQTTTVPATTTTAAEPEAVVYDDGRAVLEYAGEYVVYETVFDKSILVYATTDRVRCWFDFDSETWGVLEAVTPAVDDENLKEKLKQFNKSDYTTAAEYFDHEIYLENPDGYTQKDIDFLKSLDLEFIYVYVNKPCDLSFLGELNTVCELSIQSAVMDLTPLETPTYIESYDFLKTMTGLETLWLYSGYSDFDLSMLNNSSKLVELDIIGYNISGETRLDNLKQFDTYKNVLSDEQKAQLLKWHSQCKITEYDFAI